MIRHPIPPVWDENSRILILGSFPSVRSREEGFFYGHPRNRFWKVLAALFSEPEPRSTEEKKALLHRHRIALWDVIGSCEIRGSQDSSITGAVPNDLSSILQNAPVQRIVLNGKTAEKFYRRYHPDLPIPTVTLPSTSPANAAKALPELIEAWRGILP